MQFRSDPGLALTTPLLLSGAEQQRRLLGMQFRSEPGLALRTPLLLSGAEASFPIDAVDDYASELSSLEDDAKNDVEHDVSVDFFNSTPGRHTPALQFQRAAGMTEMPQQLDRAAEVQDKDDGHIATQLMAALFAAFMCTTDTVSMGAVLFPGADPGLKAQGISMCLLTMAVTNIVLALFSTVPHGVGALTDTVVPILGSFFSSIDGLESPTTAVVAIPVLTVATGLGIYIAGRVGISEIVRACPYAVFGGFIAGTGAQLIELGLNMMLPGFVGILSLESWANLLTLRGAQLCGPGIATAVFTFCLPRYCPRVDPYLLPVMVVTLMCSFYAALFWSGYSLWDARQAGWLFDMEIPHGVDFDKVWTYFCLEGVRWDKICSARFVFVFLQLFCVSLLTTVKNIYGTSEFTKTKADVDHEIRTTGLANAACGLFGGCPSGIVMSFSVAAHQLGARGKRFSWILAALSVLLFVFGDYLVAVLPKMVPACVVLWIGLVLLIYYIWDAVGTVSRSNYAIIVLMIFIDLSLGCGLMITIGLFLTLLITFRNMMWLPAIRTSYSLEAVRSDVLRTILHNNLLCTHGRKVLVLQLEAGLLSFVNAFKVLDSVELSDSPLEFLILDWGLVQGMEDSAVSTIKEMLQLSKRRGFFVIFAAVQPTVAAVLGRSGIVLEAVLDRHGPREAARAVVEGGGHGESVLLVRQYQDDTQFVDAMVLAVELVEECILQKHLSGVGVLGRPRIDSIRSRMLSCGEDAWEELTNLGYVPEACPGFAAVVDVHWWLRCLYRNSYEVSQLKDLAAALEEKSFDKDEVIYSFELHNRLSHMVQLAGTADAVPPLVWLLAGEVIHCWNGHRLADLCARCQPQGGLRDNLRLETASLDLDSERQCLGPFQTSAAFSGAMAHTGRLTATRKGTRVALLHRERYSSLLRSNPIAAELLNIYLTKKQFVDATRFSQTLGPQVWRRAVSST